MAHLPDFEQCMEKLQELTDLVAEMNKYRFAEQYLDNEEFCKLFNVSGKTAQIWRQSGYIPYAQIGRKIYYRLSDIEALFEKEFTRHKRLPKRKVAPRKRLRQKPGSNGWEIQLWLPVQLVQDLINNLYSYFRTRQSVWRVYGECMDKVWIEYG